VVATVEGQVGLAGLGVVALFGAFLAPVTTNRLAAGAGAVADIARIELAARVATVLVLGVK